MTVAPADIIDFWKATSGPAKWFAKSDAFDDDIRRRFEADHHAAARGEYADWAESSDGALALLLLLDQFPRNLYRGSAHAFATDPLARKVAARAVDAGMDRTVDLGLRIFFYLPFMHSEALADQDRSLALCEALGVETGDTGSANYGRHHRDIIARFGRFPHRNAVLGRESTPEELAFLAQGGFSG